MAAEGGALSAAWAARRQAAGLFRSHKSLYFYSLAKIATDPAYRFVAGALAGSRLPLLDVGCGVGLLAAYLRALGESFPIQGIDRDAEKIALAKESIPEANFLVGDALDLPPHSGNLVVLDVVHYFDQAARVQFFAEIKQRLAPGGTAYVRLTLRDKSVRFLLTRAEEWFVCASGWIPFHGAHFPSREEIFDAAATCSLQVRMAPMWGATPFNSYMLEMRSDAG